MSHFVLGKSASAFPQFAGSGELLVFVVEMSEGIESRGKYQARIPASRSSRA